MRAAPRRRRRNRSEEVLQAAVEIFHEKGYASASIQDVADRVGVLKGSLYHYIDSKEDLLARIFDESDRESFALMNEVAALELTSTERLREFSRRWSLWYLDNVERASLYLNEWRHLTGASLKRVMAQRYEYERRVIAMIDEIKAAGNAAEDLDSNFACYFILSAISGLPGWYKRRGGDPPVYIAEVYADLVMGLIENAEGRPRPSRGD